MEKRFITADELLRDSFLLGAKILESGFRPDLLIGVWRGGTPVAIAVQEYMKFRGVDCDHLPIRVSSYSGIDRRSPEVRVTGLGEVLDRIGAHRTLLLVDDVFDTGHSAQAVVEALSTHMTGEQRLCIACPWYKPGRRAVGLEPDYFLHETEQWLIFPHEVVGLTEDEIRAGKAGLAGILLDT